MPSIAQPDWGVDAMTRSVPTSTVTHRVVPVDHPPRRLERQLKLVASERPLEGHSEDREAIAALYGAGNTASSAP